MVPRVGPAAEEGQGQHSSNAEHHKNECDGESFNNSSDNATQITHECDKQRKPAESLLSGPILLSKRSNEEVSDDNSGADD
jgi:hypothetical protein